MMEIDPQTETSTTSTINTTAHVNPQLSSTTLNTSLSTTQPSYATIAQQSSNNSAHQTSIHTSQPKVHTKLNPTFDWLQNFPITDNMKNNKKLQTIFSKHLYDFFKKYFYNFYPGILLKKQPAIVNL
jgi:hypothetical protein